MVLQVLAEQEVMAKVMAALEEVETQVQVLMDLYPVVAVVAVVATIAELYPD
jgi:hypothetical protein